MFEHYLQSIGRSVQRGRFTPRRHPLTARLEIERLECRVVPSGTRSAILDFDGADLSAADLAEGGWTATYQYAPPDTSCTSFRTLFNSAHPGLDVNGDAVVNGADADLAIERILAKVQGHYAAYDLNIFTGNQDEHQPVLTDATVGDVMVIITADPAYSWTDENRQTGLAPYTDLANEHDEIVFVFGGNLSSSYNSADVFINHVAQLVSHEMGHGFGLAHQWNSSEHPDAITHHIMTYVTPDYGHSFNFQDLTYQTDAYYFHDFETNHYHAETDPYNPQIMYRYQNAHQILSNPNVLGPSPKSWVATLKPGELTIMGNDAANTIHVEAGAGNQWIVTIDGVRTFLDAATPGSESLNPFVAPLTKINVYGNGGNDSVNVQVSGVSVTWDGGIGIDTLIGPDSPMIWTITGNDSGAATPPVHITFVAVENLHGGGLADRFVLSNGISFSGAIDGGGGTDTLDYTACTYNLGVNLATGIATSVSGGIRNIENVTGGSGNDTIAGNAGANILLGGPGSDTLFGDDGRDLLIGGLGADTLVGGAGDDLLVGGTTIFDANERDLYALLTEWQTTQTYQKRIDRLRNGTGISLVDGTPIRLTSTTVLDDGVADVLTGGMDQDWFWAILTGSIKDRTDRQRGEIVN